MIKKKIKKIFGWGRIIKQNQLIYYPKNIFEIKEIIKYARENDKKFCFKGGSQSYHDMFLSYNNIVIDSKNLNKIKYLDNNKHTLLAESGVTSSQLINFLSEKNYIFSSLPGTPKATLGGMIATNCHGKDNKNNNFGKQIIELKVIYPDLSLKNIKNTDPEFNLIVGSAGLLCMILEVKISLKKNISFSNLIARKYIIFSNIDEGINKLIHSNDYYNVAWIDCFSKDLRGVIETANWISERKNFKKIFVHKKSLFEDIFLTFYYFIAKRIISRLLVKLMNNVLFNLLYLKKNKTKNIDFTTFYFFHKRIPFEMSRLAPGGFFEIQLLVNKSKKNLIKEILIITKKYRLESWFCGMKIHTKDDFCISFSEDGISITINFPYKQTLKNNFKLLIADIFNLVNENNILFNLSKDSVLNKINFNKMYINSNFFLKHKYKVDKKNLIQSDFYKRLML